MRRWLCGLPRAIACLLFVFGAAVPAYAQYDLDPATNPWFPRFPKPAKVYRSLNVNAVGGVAGAEIFTLHSLAGLAAKSVREGLGDTMIWLDLQGLNEYYEPIFENVRAAASVTNLGALATWNLVDIFRARGIVKGYILYTPDSSSRGPYEDGAFDESVNVATSVCPILGGILVTPEQEATAQSHGLGLLLDARGRTEQWAWNTYGAQFTRLAVLVQDPKLCLARDYAIGLQAFCMFGADALAGTVYGAMNPNTPVLGWNQGDELTHTRLATDWGHWNTGSNYLSNLPFTSCIKPGVDFPVAETDLNAKSRVDLLQLTWEEGVHYTSLVLSDGDNHNFNVYYLNDPDRMYYQHRARGEFKFGWGTAADGHFQVAPSVLRLLAAEATANDSHMVVGGGYYYLDRYGRNRADAALSDHLAQFRPLLEAMGQHQYFCIYDYSQWNSSAANAARATVAQSLPFLDGAFGIDYSPYAAGQGHIFWNDNGHGVDVPTFMARHAIWSNSPFTMDGTPLEIAAALNASAHTGPANSADYFDWTIVHAWSFFQNGLDIPQNTAANINAGIERGYGSARWCAQNLASHVRLVKPDELAWYARLHLRTQQTFGIFLDRAHEDLQASGKPPEEIAQFQARIDAQRTSIAHVDYGSEAAKHAAFDTIQALRQQILAPGAVSDSDNDGLPDSWEERYFGTLDSGPNDDPDGDAYTNAQELAQNGDPRDPASPPPFSVTLGCTAPDPTNVSPIACEATFGKSVADFTASDVSVSGAVVEGFGGSGTHYTFALVPSGSDVVITVQIPAGLTHGASGGRNAASNQLSRHFDNAAPNAPRVSGPNITNSKYPTWTWSSSGGNGAFRYQLDSTAGAWTPTTATSFTPATALSDMTHTLYVQERDAAGNWSGSGSFGVRVDTAPPNTPVVTAESPTDAPRPAWSWVSGGPDGSGVFRCRVDGDSGTWTETAALTFVPGVDLAAGPHTLYVQERDLAGNWSESGTRTVSIIPNVVVTGRIEQDGVAIEGVTLQGLPGEPITDANGIYTATVPLRWSGHISPQRAGYAFAPATRAVSTLVADRGDQDFSASCADIGVPANVRASDGAYADRVRVEWEAVEGVIGYLVFRSEGHDPAHADQTTSVPATGLSYDDLTARAPEQGGESAGCNPGGQPVTYVRYQYWVKAVGPCTESSFSSPDEGYRGKSAGKGLFGSVQPKDDWVLAEASVLGGMGYGTATAEPVPSRTRHDAGDTLVLLSGLVLTIALGNGRRRRAA